jgi:hypothetical protein
MTPIPGPETEEPVICFFDLESDSTYCVNQTAPITVTGSNPIYFVQLTLTDDVATHIENVAGYGTNVVTFDLVAGPTESGPVTVEASMTCFEGLTGDSNVNIPEGTQAECTNFYITLLRDDGQIVNPSILSSFNVKNFTWGIACPFDSTYLGGGEWLIEVTGNFDAVDKYWIFYEVEPGPNPGLYPTIETQYPYKYLAADKQQAADAIIPGDYSDNVPFFNIAKVWDFFPTECGPPCSYTGPANMVNIDTTIDKPPVPPVCYNANNFRDYTSTPSQPRVYAKGGSFQGWTAVIQSSINYDITMQSRGYGLPGERGRLFVFLHYNQYDWQGGCANSVVMGNAPAPTCTVRNIIFNNCSGPGSTDMRQEYFATITESVSDGLTNGVFPPPLQSSPTDPPYPPAYFDTTTIVAPSISGLTHYFFYLPTWFALPYECDVPPCQFLFAIPYAFGIVDNGPGAPFIIWSMIDFSYQIVGL